MVFVSISSVSLIVRISTLQVDDKGAIPLQSIMNISIKTRNQVI